MAVGAALCALSVTPFAYAASRPYYITEQRMTAIVEEHHDWGAGRAVEVLDASCIGQGYSRGQFPYRRFHLFGCYVTATGWCAEYHFNVTASGRAVTYRPTLISTYRC